MDDDDLMAGGDLLLFGGVGESFLSSCFTAKDVSRALAGMSGDITVRVNSSGGNAFEGSAIYAALKAYPGKVTVRVEGVAASSASLIVMAGDDIEMADGALMMIHDPAMWTASGRGTAEDHRRDAALLEKVADNFAAIYASRAGVKLDEARAAMVAETWMTADDAVSMGYADRKTAMEAVEAAAFDFTLYARAPEALRALAQAKGWRVASASVAVPATAFNRKDPAMADTPEAAVSPAAPVKTPAVAPAPEMKADPEAARIVAMSRRRDAVVARFGEDLTAKQVDAVVTAAADDAAAMMAAADIVIAARLKGAGPESRPSAVVTSDEGERKVEAMIGALSATMFGTPIEGASAQYRGLTVKKLAMELSGKPRFGFDDLEMVKAGMSARGVLMSGGMHSTSDFTYLTAETINRALRAAYNSRPGTWRRISRQRTATDFRTLYSVQAGADVEMRTVNEAGEYQSTVMTDAGDSFRVQRYGRAVNLTFELVINDDMRAFERLPQDFARGAMNLESRIVWGLINGNATMADGVALFATAATRKNLASSNAAISEAAVALGRKAMWEQRPLGAKATGDDFISAVPNLLFVPPALEFKALQFASNTVPTQDSLTNPFKGTLEPIVEPRLGAAVSGGSDTAWYLFDSSLPTVEHAFLSGYEAPRVTTKENDNPKGVTMTAEHMFGAGTVEFRGAFKNAGA